MAEQIGSEFRLWFCIYCRIEFLDLYEYADHLESKAHRISLWNRYYGDKQSEEKAMSPSPISEKEVECEFVEYWEHYVCIECDKVIVGKLNYELHKHSKMHQKNFRMANMSKEGDMAKDLPDDSSMDTYFTDYKESHVYCKACDKIFNGPEPLKHHMNSERHKRKEAFQKALTTVVAARDSQKYRSDYTRYEISEREILGFSPDQKLEPKAGTSQDYSENAKQAELKRRQENMASAKNARYFQPEALRSIQKYHKKHEDRLEKRRKLE